MSSRSGEACCELLYSVYLYLYSILVLLVNVVVLESASSVRSQEIGWKEMSKISYYGQRGTHKTVTQYEGDLRSFCFITKQMEYS